MLHQLGLEKGLGTRKESDRQTDRLQGSQKGRPGNAPLDGSILSYIRYVLSYLIIYFPPAKLSTLNTTISEGGTDSTHTHNLVQSQSYPGLKLLLTDTKSTKTIHSMLMYHRFFKKKLVCVVISACHMLVNEHCKMLILLVSSIKC